MPLSAEAQLRSPGEMKRLWRLGEGLEVLLIIRLVNKQTISHVYPFLVGFCHLPRTLFREGPC